MKNGATVNRKSGLQAALISVIAIVFILLFLSQLKNWGGKKGSKGAIIISASQLWLDYQSDFENADKQYRGKLLSVSGTISRVSTFMNYPAISMKVDNESHFDNVSFLFSTQKYNDKISELHAGDEITILGTCSGTEIGNSVTIWESSASNGTEYIYVNDCYFSE